MPLWGHRQAWDLNRLVLSPLCLPSSRNVPEQHVHRFTTKQKSSGCSFALHDRWGKSRASSESSITCCLGLSIFSKVLKLDNKVLNLCRPHLFWTCWLWLQLLSQKLLYYFAFHTIRLAILWSEVVVVVTTGGSLTLCDLSSGETPDWSSNNFLWRKQERSDKVNPVILLLLCVILLRRTQSGFWKNHSTVTSLSNINHKSLRGFDEGYFTESFQHNRPWSLPIVEYRWYNLNETAFECCFVIYSHENVLGRECPVTVLPRDGCLKNYSISLLYHQPIAHGTSRKSVTPTRLISKLITRKIHQSDLGHLTPSIDNLSQPVENVTHQEDSITQEAPPTSHPPNHYENDAGTIFIEH